MGVHECTHMFLSLDIVTIIIVVVLFIVPGMNVICSIDMRIRDSLPSTGTNGCKNYVFFQEAFFQLLKFLKDF